MDVSRFAEGYISPANHAVAEAQKEEPEVAQLMEGPRKWTSFFDDQLMGYLKGEPIESPEALVQQLSDYSHNWLVPHLQNTVLSIRELIPHSEDARMAANELHFHSMNRELLPMWVRLLLSDYTKPLTIDELYSMQVRLSIHTIEISRAKAAPSATLGMIQAFDGQLTEIDAAVTFLEQMKPGIKNGDPEIVFVPGPQRFEAGHNNRRRSADFIALDIDNQEARGIQVKTYLTSLFENPNSHPATSASQTNTSLKRYDEEYITLIDGSADLGNSWFSADKRRIVAAPGLTSINFLNNMVSVKQIRQNPLLRHGVQPIMLAKLRAKELAGNTKPYFKFSTTHVIDRVLHDMYKDTDKKEPSL